MMPNMLAADDQPIVSRPLGDAIWITSLITPDNPDVQLKYDELAGDLNSTEDIATALWRYVSSFRYNELIASAIIAGGVSSRERDTWFYPSEAMRMKISNCANRSFLMASLLKNDPYSTNTMCVMGTIKLDGIGGHAWVTTNINGRDYIIETTQPNLSRALIPVDMADAYQPMVAFDDKNVYAFESVENIQALLNERFGLCAVDFLHEYLCDRCLGLEGRHG